MVPRLVRKLTKLERERERRMLEALLKRTTRSRSMSLSLSDFLLLSLRGPLSSLSFLYLHRFTLVFSFSHLFASHRN